jgi:hypothetical protein
MAGDFIMLDELVIIDSKGEVCLILEGPSKGMPFLPGPVLEA